MDGDNTDQVIRALDNHRLKTAALFDDLGHTFERRFLFAAQRQVEDTILGDHHKLGQIKRVGTLTQDLALWPLLPTTFQKRRHILEIIGCDIGGQRLCRLQRLTIAGKDIANLALRNGHQRHTVNAVLKRDK